MDTSGNAGVHAGEAPSGCWDGSKKLQWMLGVGLLRSTLQLTLACACAPRRQVVQNTKERLWQLAHELHAPLLRPAVQQLARGCCSGNVFLDGTGRPETRAAVAGVQRNRTAIGTAPYPRG